MVQIPPDGLLGLKMIVFLIGGFILLMFLKIAAEWILEKMYHRIMMMGTSPTIRGVTKEAEESIISKPPPIQNEPKKRRYRKRNRKTK